MNFPDRARFAFIFNLEGCLINTSESDFSIWSSISKKIGLDYTDSIHEKIKNKSLNESLDYLIKTANVKLSDEEINKIQEELLRIYESHFENLNESDLKLSVLKFLKEAKRIDTPMAIASEIKNAEKVLFKMGISDFFNVIVDGRMGLNKKPDPRVFITAAALLNQPANHCIVFENSTIGITAGLKANMKVVGMGPREILTEADLVFEGFDKFKAYEVVNWFSIM